MSDTVIPWNDVTVAMESAIAAAKTVTAITKADPAVATCATHGFADGAYVLILASGMSAVDRRVFRVNNPLASTFELEGEDATGYKTFRAGTAALLTMNATIDTITNVTRSGGDGQYEDASTIHGSNARQFPVGMSPLVYSFELMFDPANAGHIAMRKASALRARKAFEFTFQNGAKMVFAGYVTMSGAPQGAANSLAKTDVSISVEGLPTFYAS